MSYEGTYTKLKALKARWQVRNSDAEQLVIAESIRSCESVLSSENDAGMAKLSEQESEPSEANNRTSAGSINRLGP